MLHTLNLHSVYVNYISIEMKEKNQKQAQTNKAKDW